MISNNDSSLPPLPPPHPTPLPTPPPDIMHSMCAVIVIVIQLAESSSYVEIVIFRKLEVYLTASSKFQKSIFEQNLPRCEFAYFYQCPIRDSTNEEVSQAVLGLEAGCDEQMMIVNWWNIQASPGHKLLPESSLRIAAMHAIQSGV